MHLSLQSNNIPKHLTCEALHATIIMIESWNHSRLLRLSLREFKMTTIHNPLHPGEIVKDALFTDTNLTVTTAAQLLKVARSTLSRLLNGHAGISVDMAYRLSLLLNTSAEMWLNLQRDYDLWQVNHHASNLEIIPLKKAA